MIICEKIDHVITAPHCTCFQFDQDGILYHDRDFYVGNASEVEKYKKAEVDMFVEVAQALGAADEEATRAMAEDVWFFERSLAKVGLFWVNTFRPEQHERHFAEDILKCSFFDKNGSVFIKILLEFVTEGPIGNKSALVQEMAWHQTVGER